MHEFKPASPSHAIERCAVQLAFSDVIPDKGLTTIVEQSAAHASALGMHRDAGGLGRGIQIDMATGKMMPITGSVGPAAFSTADRAQQLMFLPNAINFVTHKYVSWKQFMADFHKAADVALEQYEKLASVVAVQIEYWDRFTWTGNWDDFRTTNLINEKSSLVAPIFNRAKRELHSHVGWFEDEDTHRRLWNVNVDVLGLGNLPGQVRPSVGIYTLGRDTALDAKREGFGKTPYYDRLEVLHDNLKAHLKEVIVEPMAKKIGL
ncbi:MAG: TIGR04255 family protein [Aestuariivirga sp.]